MPPGLDKLQHIVVLMMQSRSFDHMLGSLKAIDPRIDGILDSDPFANPDAQGKDVKPRPLAEFQGQLSPPPADHFSAVDLQIFGGSKSENRQPNMQGFVTSYFNQHGDSGHSQKVMHYFKQSDLPVLSTLALEFAVFNRWFASVPGPTNCNRAFAHYGTCFGRVDLNPIHPPETIRSIYTRLIKGTPRRTSRIYYYDSTSSTMEVANLLQNSPALFGTYSQFLADCQKGNLPDYSFIEPNYSDHQADTGDEIANDQHPHHNVQAGELLIASVYSAIKNNPLLWQSTALLITYDQHGGIFDHVPPPFCTSDQFTAGGNATGTGIPFRFDRLGVRVPTVLISPWIPKGTVVDRVFDHASIPATVTGFFLQGGLERSPREAGAEVFIEPKNSAADPARNLLSLNAMRADCPDFIIVKETARRPSAPAKEASLIWIPVRLSQSSYNPDRPLSTLLKMQVEHLYEAETRLPPKFHSGTYVNAIRTEGEAAVYIRSVTRAILEAHDEALRIRTARNRARIIEIAAVADKRGKRKHSRATKEKPARRKTSRRP